MCGVLIFLLSYVFDGEICSIVVEEFTMSAVPSELLIQGVSVKSVQFENLDLKSR